MSNPHSPAIRLPSDQDAGGRTLGDEEIAAVTAALRSGTLTSTRGSFVRGFEEAFATVMGTRFAVACSSGTAALHAAFAAIDPEPGEEIVTSPITDMGAIAPILYQGAIPVFADVDPVSLNVTAATIEARLSVRTRAIVVTHLFGNPCEMEPIRALAAARDLPLVEDCAQAFLARAGSALVGGIGDMGCFSLQQGKHITAGEGGVVITDDAALARRLRLFVNKAWPYGEPSPDHGFLALNYRMNELTGAVVGAQLGKLEPSVESRRRAAALLHSLLADVPGLTLPAAPSGSVHSWWRYALSVDPDAIPGGTDALGAALSSLGIGAAPRYIRKPAFECSVIADRVTFGRSGWPFTLARPQAVDYRRELFPGVHEGLARVLVLPWNERFTEDHVRAIAGAVRGAVAALRGSTS